MREAVRLGPDDAQAHLNLGSALWRQGKADEAIAEIREAARLDGKATTYYSLGTALDMRGKYDQAESAYREAVRLDGEHIGEAIFNLGSLLRRLGRYDESRATYLRARTLAEVDDQPNQVQRAGRELGFTDQWRALEPRLSEILRGADRPRDRTELADIGQMCRDRRLYAAGARLFEAALRDAPELDGDTLSPQRCAAGLLAVLAGCRAGADDPPPGDAERAQFRGLALRWLKAELAAARRHLDADPPRNRGAVAGWMRGWRSHPDLGGVREPDDLKKLPGPERDGWRALWAEVDTLLAKARGETPWTSDGPSCSTCPAGSGPTAGHGLR
jgi:tetratricopeptide (TPR) repeat protein